METNTIQHFSIAIPNSDLKLLKSLVKRMGWTLHTDKKCGIDKALDDIEKGRVYKAKDADDLIKKIVG